jgi:hypothetical protein
MSRQALLQKAAAERIQELAIERGRTLTPVERHALEKGQLRLWHLLGREAMIIAQQRLKKQEVPARG